MNARNTANPLNIKNILFNDAGHLRSGWRFLIFQLLFIFFGAFFGETIQFLLANLSVSYEKGSVLSFVVPNGILLTLSLALGWLCGRVLENLPFSALGLWFTKNWWRDLGLGLAIGALSIGFAVLLGVLFGGIKLELNQTMGTTAILLTLGVSLFVFVIGALAEEAYFRGYILQTFARARLAWLAIVFTSLFFASAHLNNQHTDWLSTLNTILAGIWFSLAYLKTRNLWFPFGIHLMWNWLQGAFFGLPVSGITTLTTAPYLQETDKGITLWTGGDYGIEGGIACTIAIIASGVLIWFIPFGISKSKEVSYI
ncbi:MAG: CPBP family intramembrane metalloprotease [Acidobacteriota bacterium]|nr:CPBP family intramembrane metalloprotease [Acidobacteriota bacterium]